MATTDYGLEKLGSYLMGLSPNFPGSCEFGVGSTIFYSGSSYLADGRLRKPVTWTWMDEDPRGGVLLPTTDMVGSTIGEFGFGYTSSVGSDIFFRELSAVGTKDTSFDVELTMKVRVRRSV